MTDNDPAFLARARLITDELFPVLRDEPSMGQSGAVRPSSQLCWTRRHSSPKPSALTAIATGNLTNAAPD